MVKQSVKLTITLLLFVSNSLFCFSLPRVFVLIGQAVNKSLRGPENQENKAVQVKEIEEEEDLDGADNKTIEYNSLRGFNGTAVTFNSSSTKSESTFSVSLNKDVIENPYEYQVSVGNMIYCGAVTAGSYGIFNRLICSGKPLRLITPKAALKMVLNFPKNLLCGWNKDLPQEIEVPRGSASNQEPVIVKVDSVSANRVPISVHIVESLKEPQVTVKEPVESLQATVKAAVKSEELIKKESTNVLKVIIKAEQAGDTRIFEKSLFQRARVSLKNNVAFMTALVLFNYYKEFDKLTNFDAYCNSKIESEIKSTIESEQLKKA